DGDGDCAESCDEQADDCLGDDPNGSACDDGSFCNGTETCTGGVCENSTGSPCDEADGDADCAESCDENADNCLANDPNVPAIPVTGPTAMATARRPVTNRTTIASETIPTARRATTGYSAPG
ncbi:MAG: hypothetical protein ACYTFA_18825, partial [Planctomycetota bacterium]